MKTYYADDVHFTAKAEEFQMLRVAMSTWLREWDGFKDGTPEDAAYYLQMHQLYKDVTKILEQLPF